MDKVRDRMERARQQHIEKKLMTDRGMPAQLKEDLNKIQAPLTFQPNTSKFKSAFDSNNKQPKNQGGYLSFHDSQAVDAN